MAASNTFLQFAGGSSANVVTDAQWAALLGSGGADATGFVAGIATSAQVNKALRQTTAWAAVLGQIVVDQLGVTVTDGDGTPSLEANILAALNKAAIGRLIKRTVFPVGTTNWTPDPRTTFVRYRIVGDGGSAGGCAALAANAGTACASTGGGSGAYEEGEFVIDPSVANASIIIPVTVGAGGIAPTAGANNGNPGAGSSIGGRRCPGGVGGLAGNPMVPPYINFSGAVAGFSSGSVGTGVIDLTPYFADPGGSPGDGIIMSLTNVKPGIGANSIIGHGALASNGLGRGGGGPGSATVPNGAATSATAGDAGFVQIAEST